MSKKLTLIANDKEYTLRFTRKTIQRMEDKGFIASEIGDKPATMIPMLFEGAFLAEHRFVKKDVIDEIYNGIKNKNELINKLLELYYEPIEELFGSNEDEQTESGEAEGNTLWEANF